MDVVLFQLAQLLAEDKQEERARPLYKRLIKEYPQSPYLPHAYLAFADHFFESRDLENAVSFYDRVLQYPDSSVYGYALYKQATHGDVHGTRPRDPVGAAKYDAWEQVVGMSRREAMEHYVALIDAQKKA